MHSAPVVQAFKVEIFIHYDLYLKIFFAPNENVIIFSEKEYSFFGRTMKWVNLPHEFFNN